MIGNLDMRAVTRKVAAVSIAGSTTVLVIVDIVLSALDGRVLQTLPEAGVVAFPAVGGLITVRRPANRIGWLLSVAGLAIALLSAATEYAWRALIHAPGSLPGGRVAADIMTWLPPAIIGLLVGLLPQVFPDGRPLSRRWRIPMWAAWIFIVGAVAGNAVSVETVEGLGNYQNPYAIPALKSVVTPVLILSGLCLLMAAVAGLAALALRWRRSQTDQRQQIKWLLAGLVPLIVPVATHDVWQGFSEVAIAVLLPFVPICIGVAVFRYRLYDLDVVLNRAAVYTVVSGLVAGLYLGLVALVETFANASDGQGVHVVAAVAAAAAFTPLRSRVQWAVDTVFYGERSRPYEALTQLGRLLERAPMPQTVLPGIVDTVAQALRLPYVAVELDTSAGPEIAAARGTPVGQPERFPMVYQDEITGRLLVSSRGGQDAFNHADRRLLADLARHAGVAAHAVALTMALQRSRVALVSAREEERRRLRRDLHDGLGPALAGVTLGLHAAAANVTRSPEQAVAQIGELTHQVEESVKDIRRLVYGLRPPALDELGLARAVQREAQRLEGGSSDLSIGVEIAEGGLGALPAAVEVAAYRIVCEALTNVSRHAYARTCKVRLVRDAALCLEVNDDGRGINGHTPGVGLTAMRERAEELGGTLRVYSEGVGTRVVAELPVELV